MYTAFIDTVLRSGAAREPPQMPRAQHPMLGRWNPPLSQRVPMNPGGQMHSPTWSWQMPPFRQSGQSFSQDGPHFFAGQAAERAEGARVPPAAGQGTPGSPQPPGSQGPAHLSR